MTEPSAPNEDAQQQEHECVIARSAAECFAAFCDVELTPQWVPDVRTARVRHYDDDGRPRVVDFMAGPARGGYVYAHRYQYEAGACTVSWATEGSSGIRRMSGRVVFQATDTGTCRMRYENRIEVPGGLPQWARAAQLDRPVAEICAAFRRWVESR